MMKCFSYFAVLTILGVAAAGARAQGNLITNGSFELPISTGANEIIPGGNSTAVAGWTTVLNGVERFAPALYGVGPAPDGNVVIDVSPFTFTGGGIEQTVPTTAGQSYSLSFLAGTSNAFSRTGDAILVVDAGSTSQNFTLFNPQAAVVYNKYTMNFTATSTTTTVRFSNLQDANTHFTFIDNVSIPVTVPEPGTIGLAFPMIGVVCIQSTRRHKRKSESK